MGSFGAPQEQPWDPPKQVFWLSEALWGPLGTLLGLSSSLSVLFISSRESPGLSHEVSYLIFQQNSSPIPSQVSQVTVQS